MSTPSSLRCWAERSRGSDVAEVDDVDELEVDHEGRRAAPPDDLDGLRASTTVEAIGFWTDHGILTMLQGRRRPTSAARTRWTTAWIPTTGPGWTVSDPRAVPVGQDHGPFVVTVLRGSTARTGHGYGDRAALSTEILVERVKSTDFGGKG